MKTTDVIKHFRTAVAAAAAMNDDDPEWTISTQAISQWGEFPPRGRQLQLQEITEGALKVEKKKVRAHG